MEHGVNSPSPAEMKVLTALMKTGGSDKELARELGISLSTIKVHMSALLRKSGTDKRVKLVLWAIREGLVTL